MKTIREKITVTHILLFLILLAGCLLRLWKFGQLPDGVNQDEAFAGYEAYSLLHSGIDSHGYSFPVYLTTWGSGMNALNTYLMIPFIALFGLHAWVIRIPQVLVGIFSILAIYGIGKEIKDKKLGLIAAFLLAIVPWHVLLSRWGLESNLAPGFLLFGLYFFLLGMRKKFFLPISAVFYGLSLYCYATIWPFVPFILLIQVLYGIYHKKIGFHKAEIASFFILFFLALPLMLFLLVNYGLIPEIRLPFLSIPKLLHMRTEIFSLKHIGKNARVLWSILFTQTDNFYSNSTPKTGLYYAPTLPFAFLGIGYSFYRVIQGFRKKEYTPELFVLLQILAAIALSCTAYVNVNRVNVIFPPLILMAAVGICFLFQKRNLLYVLIVCLYVGLSIPFIRYYFTQYQKDTVWYFKTGFREAYEEAARYDNPIYISDKIPHSIVLFYSKIPVEEYRETVVYKTYPAPFLDTVSFGNHYFYEDSFSIQPNSTYILPAGTDLTPFARRGFSIIKQEHYSLAIDLK